MTMLDLRAEVTRRGRPVVPSLPALNASAVETWRGRMVNEHGSAQVFAQLAEQMRAAGFSPEQVATCARFADEERRHGELCGSVVEALGVEAVAEGLPDRALPWHDDVAPVEGVLRNLLSVSCLSETVAVALIGAERALMPEGELRDLLTSIWADEIGHARFGWGIVSRWVPTLDEAARARLGVYLRVAFGHLEAHELAHLATDACPPPEGAALGLCNGDDARSLFFATVTDVIVPRLEEMGLSAAHAWATRLPG